MSKAKMSKLLAFVLGLVMLGCVGTAFFNPSMVWATSTPSSGSEEPPVNSGAISVVSYNTDSTLGRGDVTPLTTISSGTTFDLLIKISDSRPEVLAWAAKMNYDPQSFIPVLIQNSSSFTRGRDMTKDGGRYQDFRLESSGPNGLYFPLSPDQKSITYALRVPLTYNGTGNTFQANISYQGLNTVEMQTISLQLNTTVDKEEVKTETRGTGFVLKSADYGESSIKAGSSFKLTAVILSTNGTYNVENVSVGITPAEQISLQTGSSINYVGTVKPNQSVPISFDLLASAIADNGSYKVTLNIQGVNAKDGTEVSASMDIAIPVVQPDRFEISSSTIPDYLSVGMADGSGYGTVNLVNKGKGSVYNVEVEIVGEGLYAEEGKQFIGTIAGGGQNSADFNLMASEAGQLSGQVVVSYENDKGEVSTLTKDFSVTADDMGGGIDPGIIDPGIVDPGIEPEQGMPMWAWVLIVVGVLAAAGVVVVVVLKKRKARKDALLEEELGEDEDDGDDFDAPASSTVSQTNKAQPSNNSEKPEE